MNTYGQTTAATWALTYRPRPCTHAEQRQQVIDDLDQDDREVAG